MKILRISIILFVLLANCVINNTQVPGVPTKLAVSNTTPTSFCITISPPVNITLNATIQSYTVSYQGELFNTTLYNVSVLVNASYPLNATSSVCINGLEEFNNYFVSARAVNGAGVGTNISDLFRTLASAPITTPQNVSTTSVTATSIIVCFDPPTGSSQNGIITSFDVLYTGSPFQTTQVVVNANVTPAEYPLTRIVCTDLLNLEENNNYDISIQLINSAGTGPASTDITALTQVAVSEAPTQLAVSNTTSTSFCITIYPPANVTQNGVIQSYTVSYKGELFNTTQVIVSVTVVATYPLTASSSVCIYGLEEFNNYTVAVSAVNGAGEGAAITEVFRTLESAPITAQNVSASSIAATEISVCFDPPTGSSQNGIITSFDVLYTGSPFQTSEVVANVNVTPTEYPLTRTVCTNLTNLQENNNYDISIQLINSAGTGPASTDITALTQVAVSEAPTQLAVSNTTSTSFCITIYPPANVTQNGVIQSYTVSYKGELFNTTQVIVSVTVVATYPLTASSSVCIYGLEEFNNYTVAVSAVNGAGEGAAITEVFRTLESAPITAQNVSASSIAATEISVCFDPPTGSSQNGIITSFDVLYTGSPFQTSEVVANVNVTPTEYPLTRTVCTNLTNLQENNNYNISIRLINSAGSGPTSTDITALTLEAAPAAAPTNIVLRTLGPQTIQVTICPPAMIDQNGLILRYIVSYTGDPFDTSAQSITVNASLSYPAIACINATLNGLQEFNNYTVTVQAVNSIGSSDSSAGVVALTDQAVSEAPTQLAVSNTTSTSFCITIYPPVNVTQNGVIQSYTVSYQGVLFNTTLYNVSVPVVATYPLTASSSVCIYGLEEFNNYTVAVSAVNGAGVGAAITDVFRTLASVSEAPTQLAVSNTTSTSFCITIYPPANVTQNGVIQSYTVSYQGELFNTTQVIVSASVVAPYPLTASSSVCIYGLEEFNNYTVAVSAVNGAGVGADITDVFRTLASVPITAPQNISTTSIAATSITVCFDSPTGSSQNGIITSFDIIYTGSPFQTTQVVANVNVTPTEYPLTRTVCTNITNLEENNSYNISIRLINSAGSGPASTDITALTLEAVPITAPQNVSATSITATTITVCFDPPTGSSQNGIITSFDVLYTGSPFQTTQVVANVNVTPTEYPLTRIVCTNITNLQENNNYTISIRLNNSAGSGPVSTDITALTLEAVSGAPTQLAVSNTTSTSFCITIYPPVNITQNGVIQSYNVSYQGELFNTTQVIVSVSVVATYPLTATSRVCIYGLEEFNNYTVAVSAVNGAGVGAAITDVFRTLESVPITAPQNVSTTSITATTITVCFDPPTGSSQNGIITSFDVIYTGSPFQTTQVVANVNVTPTEYPLTRTLCTNLTNLQENNNYTISIRLINSVGSGPTSTDITVLTPETAPAAAPTNIVLRTLGPQSIQVTICPPAMIDQNGLILRYIVSYTGDPFDTSAQSITVNASLLYPAIACINATLNGLQEFNNYTVTVQAENSIGSSGSSAGMVALTDQAVSEAPTLLAVSNTTSTSFCITIYPPANVTQNGVIQSYTVSYRGELFNTTQVIVSVSVVAPYPLTASSRVCIYGLEEFNNYTVVVSAVNGAGVGAAITEVFRTLASAPITAPQNVSTTSVTSTTITVCFDPPTGSSQNGIITSFDVLYTGSPFQTTQVVANVNVTPTEYPLTRNLCTNLPNLQEHNSYTISIRLINNAGLGPASTDIIVITLQAVSEAPTQLAVSNTTSTSFCITIYPPVNVTQNGVIQSYTVSYQGELFNTTQVFVSVSVVATYPLTASSSVCIYGLEEFNNYTVAVSAVNGAGEGAAITDVFRTLTSAPITAPQNVSTTSVTATTIIVCFDPPTGSSQNGIITSFDVLYTGSPFQTSEVVANVNVTPTEYPLMRNLCTNITNLEENNSYTISIRLNNSAGSGPVSTVITVLTLEATPAAAPTNIVLRTLGPQSIQVTICPPAAINQNGLILGYTVSYTGDPFDTSTQFNTVNASLSYPAIACINTTLNGLQEFDNYTVTVQAVNSIGSSDSSAGVVAETDQAAPTATPTVSLTVNNSQSIRVTICPPLQIDQNGLITNYIVRYSGDPFDTNTDNFSVSISIPYPAVTCTNTTLTALQEYNNYTVSVQAQNSVGLSSFSPGVTAQTDQAVPGAPDQLAVSNTTSTSFCITIYPPVNVTQNGEIQSYTVSYQGELFNTTQVILSVPVVAPYPLTASSSVCIYGLEEFNDYSIAVSAVNGAGEGAAITEVFRTLTSAPINAPQKVSASSITATTIIVCLDPPTGSSQNGIITSFDVLYTGSPFQTTQVIDNVDVIPTEYPLTRIVCINLPNLEENNNYDISIRLINSAGTGPASTNITALTLEAAPASAPTNIVLRTLGPQSIQVTICPPASINQNGLILGYTVSYTGDPFDTSAQYNTDNASLSYPAIACINATLNGLQEFNNYTVTVQAVNSIGSSGSSAGVVAETDQAVSEAPTQLAVSNTTSTSFCITIYPPVNVTQNGVIESYTVSYQGELFNTTQVIVSVTVVAPYPLTASSSVCIYGLEEFNNYTVAVSAVNGAGVGAAITDVFRTLESAPSQAPQTVTVLTINATAIRVCFFPPQDASQNGIITSFAITYTGNPFQTAEQSETTPVTPQLYPLIGMICRTLVGLEEFNTYNISVAAVNGIGTGIASVGLTALTDQAAPSAAPLNFTAISGLNITLLFVAPLAIDQNGILTNYTIVYFGVDRDPAIRTIPVSPDQFSVTITGLEEDTTYSFTIAASTNVGQGPFTQPLIASTQTAPPASPPIDITVTVVNSTALNATWRVPDIDEHNGLLLQVEFQVQGINLDTTEREIIVSINDSNDTSIQFFIITGLEEFVNYSVILSVRNGAGISPPSDPVFESTLQAAPSSPPQNVITQALSPTSIGVTFTPPLAINQNGLVESYNVTYIGQTFDTTTQFVIVSVSNAIYPATVETLSVNLTGLQEHNNYTVRVSAINPIGASPFSDGVIQITDIAVPSESPSVAVQSVSTTYIQLLISPPASIEQNGPIIAYEISITTFRFSIAPELRNTTEISNVYPLTLSVTFNASSLQEFVEYNISVRAYTVAGSSEFSVIVQQTTIAAAPSSPPQSVSTQTLSPTSIGVTFRPPLAINQNGLVESYNVTYIGQTFDTTINFVIVSVSNAIYPATVETLSVNLTGLQEHNNYTVRVSAINQIGASPFSDGVIQITDIAAPSSPPQNVTTVALSPTSIMVTFIPPLDINQNGPNLVYNVSYTGQSFETNTQFQTVNVSNPIYPATAPVSVIIIGLEEYNNYTITVSASNVEGPSQFTAGVIQITDIAVPSESPSVAVQSVSTTVIRILISPPASIEQNGPIIAYEINITTFRFSIAPELRNTTEISNVYPLTLSVTFNASSLQEFVEYNISVRAYTVAGPSVFSGIVQEKTIATAPSSPPLSVSTQALSPTSIGVTFRPPLAINQNGLVESYNVTYIGQTFDTTTQFVIVNVLNAIYPATVETLSVNLTGLQEHNNYTVRVSAINQIGASPFSDGIIQITDIAVPSESPSVAVQSVSTTYIQLLISPPASIEQNGPIIAYEISITTFRFSIAPELRNFTVTPNVYPLTFNVAFNASSLQEFVEYNISVRAYSIAGPSVFSSIVQQTTDQSAPSSPPTITSITAGATSIEVTYVPPTQIDQNGLIILYTIFYTASLFQSVTPNITMVNITNREYPDVTNRTEVLTGLQQYVNYTITIAATTVDIGSTSTAIVVETLQEVSIAPLLISANTTNSTTVCVTFGVPEPIDQNGLIDQYFVNLSRAIDGPLNRTIPISDKQNPAEILEISRCFSDLEEGTNYTVSIRAGNGAGLGASSNTIDVNTVSVPPPDVPPFLAAAVPIVNIIPKSISLTIPDIDVSFLNGEPEFYEVFYQGSLFAGDILSTRRRKRQMDAIAMTEIFTITIAINSGRTINLGDLLPNYVYVVNISIQTATGQTPFVTVTTPSLVPTAPTGPPLSLNAAATSDTSLQFNFALDFFTLNGMLLSFSIFYKEQGTTTETIQTFIPSNIGPYQVPIIDLVANKVYLISVNVRNENGEGPRSAEINATTNPSVPTTTTVAGTTPVPTSELLPDLTTTILVPTQNIFPTANIAVIYIITDYNNPPKFQDETFDKQYRLITSTPLMDGFVFDNGIDTNIRIQAALNSTFFALPGQNSFPYIIGDSSETRFESRTFDNLPLRMGSTLYSYYYVQFLNENGITSPTFTLTSIPFQVTIPEEPSSPIGIVVALLFIIALLGGVIAALIVLIFWFRKSRNNPLTRKVGKISSTVRSMSLSTKEKADTQKQDPINPMPVLPPAVIMKSTITLPNFAKYVEEMSANDKLKFHEEYMSIKDPPHTHDMCSMSANGPRNRYRDIRTYDHSRVTLTQLDGDEYSDYINANFIHGYYKKNEYIAAQGPLDNTIADFWRMAWDWNVPTIIMLTKCVERGRRKCSQYWPDSGTTSYAFYDSNGTSKDFIQITIERETVYAHYIIREIVLSRVDFPNQQKRLTKWHYTSWPDMGVPENGTSLLKFVQKVHQSHPRDSGPMIVHCSAGVGRTGTFVTLGCMMPMIREQSLVDVYNFVNRMRDSRNRMVQVEAQYVFIHEALLEFIQHGDTEVSGEDLDTYFRTLDSEEENGASKLLGQFKRLAYPVRPTEYTIAQSPQNKAKNRYVNILPYNNKRVKLTPVPGVENSDYINASYIDGYWMKNTFIATQGPLQGTIEDFWKMIWEQHVNTIVMLTSEVEAGRERCVHYWPDENPEYYGPIMVELLDKRMDEQNEFIIHDLKMTHTKENRIRKICHFQYTGWHEREMPDSATGLNKMILDIDQWTRTTNPTHPMVVHCSAGVGRTGVFIGIFNMIESIRHENTVDVFNTVRMMRYQRPAMVQTATQYRFCYIALIDYISTSSDSLYQNVPKI